MDVSKIDFLLADGLDEMNLWSFPNWKNNEAQAFSPLKIVPFEGYDFRIPIPQCLKHDVLQAQLCHLIHHQSWFIKEPGSIVLGKTNGRITKKTAANVFGFDASDIWPTC